MEKDILVKIAGLKAICCDFDGVFTDNTVRVDQDGVESVRCWRSDGIGLSRIRSLGIKSVIISTETNPVVSVRAEKLGVECLQGVQEKAKSLNEWAQKNGIRLDDIAFIGNDINDIPALRIVGFPIGVADSYPEILKYTIYVTQKRGGYGAIREVCDWIHLAWAHRTEKINLSSENGPTK